MSLSTPQGGQARKHRIDERFTALRGCAALIVMMAHCQYVGFLPALPVFKYSGQLGVMLFFFLSAFLLSHSLTSALERGAGRSQAIGEYAINRVFRIFPLLIVVVTLCWWQGLAFFPATASYIEVVQSCVTLGKAPSVLWTIPVELTFYLYLPALLSIALRATRSPLGATAAALGFLTWCFAIAASRRLGGPAAPWMTLGFHHYANSFVGGVLLYALMHNGRLAFPKAGAAVAYAAPALFVIAVPFVRHAIFGRDWHMSEFADTLVWQAYYDEIFPFAPLVVAGIVYGILHPGDTWLSRIMRARVLRRSGELSFGVYLVHMPMIDLFGQRLGYGQPALAAAVAATFALAAVLWRVVERPGIGFGRRIGRALHFRNAPSRPIQRLAAADAAEDARRPALRA
ncbi:MAG TPA: acyltransferase [Roseiarcus sp.]|jgi:peptidoglycan/LPS O-acetylase OafA/YrhL|nr:acyltransferase [Roseiarcus sp.]